MNFQPPKSASQSPLYWFAVGFIVTIAIGLLLLTSCTTVHVDCAQGQSCNVTTTTTTNAMTTTTVPVSALPGVP